MLKLSVKGNYNKTSNKLLKLKNGAYLKHLDRYGEIGVKALRDATPKDSGETADSWSYSIDKIPEGISLSWHNSSKTYTGIPIVILLQYGHGTRNGGYVQGKDFINPAILPIFEDIANEVSREIASK